MSRKVCGCGKDLGGKYNKIWLSVEYDRKNEKSRMTQISDLRHTKGKWQEFNFEHAMFEVLSRNPKGGAE